MWKKQWSALLLCSFLLTSCTTPTTPGPIAKEDLWRSPITSDDEYKATSQPAPMSANFVARESAAVGSLGFATGGSKDINNFRDNIANDYLPLPDSITYEGLFYDYYFDMGTPKECTELFCPTYSEAASPDPFAEYLDHYLAVGLNSNLDAADFERPDLDLVVVLDISGSMSSSFDSYYYDNQGLQKELSDEDAAMSKMEVANKALITMLDHLDDNDRIGIVLYDDEAYITNPLQEVRSIELSTLKDHILEISPQGGTNMEAGFELGTSLFPKESPREQRMIFLTDAIPNTGDTSRGGLLDMVEKNAKKEQYTTFIGIGVEFNPELIEHITDTNGANYYSVHSPEAFQKRMDEGFDYMVTPLVFDLELEVGSEGISIAKVYGSPQADESTGSLMKVSTLFPSLQTEEGTKGGVVLLHLNVEDIDAPITLTASYRTADGKEHETSSTFTLQHNKEAYDNTGIQKAIALSRYASTLKDWMLNERIAQARDKKKEPTLIPYTETGIPLPRDPEILKVEWERGSLPLTVSDTYSNIFQIMESYLSETQNTLQDETLDQEISLLQDLQQ